MPHVAQLHCPTTRTLRFVREFYQPADCCKKFRTRTANVIGSNGLGITPAAPRVINLAISSDCVRAVTKTTVGTGESTFFKASNVSSPSMSGIIMSKRIKSGTSSRTSSSAACPDPAKRTLKSEASDRANSAMARMSGSSSTKRIEFRDSGSNPFGGARFTYLSQPSWPEGKLL